MKGALLKGASRRMVVVRSRDSKLFEEAHFILREDSVEPSMPDLLSEANRIVESSRFPTNRRCGSKKNVQFVIGLLTGAAIEAMGLMIYFLFQ